MKAATDQALRRIPTLHELLGVLLLQWWQQQLQGTGGTGDSSGSSLF